MNFPIYFCMSIFKAFDFKIMLFNNLNNDMIKTFSKLL